MFDEERMIGEYEVIQSTHIGARELVVGVYSDNQYMCGFYVENEILGNCTDVAVSEDYLDIMTVYAERLQHQVQAVIAERKTVKVPLTPLTAEQCYPLDEQGDFLDKVVAVKPGSLRHEYRRCDRQLIYVTSGNGARAEAQGRAVFGINIYTGRTCGRWERSDILGVVRPEHIPPWIRDKVKNITRRLELEKRGGVR